MVSGEPARVPISSVDTSFSEGMGVKGPYISASSRRTLTLPSQRRAGSIKVGDALGVAKDAVNRERSKEGARSTAVIEVDVCQENGVQFFDA